MNCEHPGCAKPATKMKVKRLGEGNKLRVECTFFCAEDAPPGSQPISRPPSPRPPRGLELKKRVAGDQLPGEK